MAKNTTSAHADAHPAKHRDTRVAVWSAFSLAGIVLTLLGAPACDDKKERVQDASTDMAQAARDSSPDQVAADAGCPGVAPMGECASAFARCCDDVFRTLQLECRGGKWSCPVGKEKFEDCCGIGSMCQPYSGGDSPPSAACRSQCRQSGSQWFCGNYFPDGGVDAPRD